MQIKWLRCVANTSVPGCAGSNCPTNPCYSGRDSQKPKPVRRYPIEEFQVHFSHCFLCFLEQMIALEGPRC